MTPRTTLVLRTPGDNKVLNEDKGQNKNIYKTLKNFIPKGIIQQKLLKHMNVIIPNKHLIGGYLKPIHTIALCNPICKPKNQQNATCKQKET